VPASRADVTPIVPSIPRDPESRLRAQFCPNALDCATTKQHLRAQHLRQFLLHDLSKSPGATTQYGHAIEMTSSEKSAATPA
jgi:hypothetical protein